MSVQRKYSLDPVIKKQLVDNRLFLYIADLSGQHSLHIRNIKSVPIQLPPAIQTIHQKTVGNGAGYGFDCIT